MYFFLLKIRYSIRWFFSDLKSGFTVFSIALPLCMGIAIACKVPVESGLISGFSGGVITGLISGSHTSVSGPSAGFVAIILDAITALKSYDILLCSVVLSGVIQILFGIFGLGRIGNYVPSSVTNGLVFSIGAILVLKQIPFLVGYDGSLTGDFSFIRVNGNTFLDLFNSINYLDSGTLIITFFSFFCLLIWERYLKRRRILRFIPVSFVIILIGIVFSYVFNRAGGILEMKGSQFVNLPFVKNDIDETAMKMIHFPNFRHIFDYIVIEYGFIIALVTSLEAILSITVAEKLDIQKRHTSINREMIAQGVGNFFSGMLGGIPLTSVIVRTSVNIKSGSRTKISTVLNGILILISALFISHFLNRIPIVSLAVLLVYAGSSLILSLNIKEIKKRGIDYIIPFSVTIIFIFLTNVIDGIIVGLLCGIFFVVRVNYAKSFKLIIEKYNIGEILRLNLPQEVSFLNKPSLVRMLDAIGDRSSVLIDGTNCSYIDEDALGALKEFIRVRSKFHHIKVGTIGFDDKYKIENESDLVTIITKEIQGSIKPEDVVKLLIDGNRRFVERRMLHRDFHKQMHDTAKNQYPVAVVLSCVDSRSIPEIIFDTNIGDILSIRIAGNIINKDIAGSIEFGCLKLGAKVVLILGHTNCGAVNTACSESAIEGNISEIIRKIRGIFNLNKENCTGKHLINKVTKLNITNSIRELLEGSESLRELKLRGEIIVIGGVHDIQTGNIEFLDDFLL